MKQRVIGLGWLMQTNRWTKLYTLKEDNVTSLDTGEPVIVLAKERFRYYNHKNHDEYGQWEVNAEDGDFVLVLTCKGSGFVFRGALERV